MMNFTDQESQFAGWSFTDDLGSERAAALSKWSSFAAIGAAVASGEVHFAGWESFGQERLSGCWRLAFELRCKDLEICDAFYNSPAGYRAQFARSVEDGVAANRWLIALLESKLLATCRERGIDIAPARCSLQGKQAKVWIVEPNDNTHLTSGPEVVRCRQWGGPGARAPIARRLEVKGAWLCSTGSVVVDPNKEHRAQQIHETGFT